MEEFSYLVDATGITFFEGERLVGFIPFDDLPDLMVDLARVLRAGKVRAS